MANRLLRLLGLAGVGFAALNVYGRYAVRRFEDLDPETAGVPGSFIDVDGVRVHYVEAGRGAPLVLVHGFAGSTFSFRYVIPELARHYRVVALDLKGFGYSERPEGADYALAAQAELVRGLMDRLGIEQATVVGHSMGGAESMRLAARYPERVARLVLVDSATDHELGRTRRLALLRPFFPMAAVFTLHRMGFRERALRFVVHDPAHVTPEMVEGYFRPMRVKGQLRALGEMASGRQREEPVDLNAVRAPTLVLWGEHDRVLPLSVGEELARELPDARLIMVPSAGHMPLEEQPEFSNRVLLEFLGPATEAPAEPGPAVSQESPA